MANRVPLRYHTEPTVAECIRVGRGMSMCQNKIATVTARNSRDASNLHNNFTIWGGHGPRGRGFGLHTTAPTGDVLEWCICTTPRLPGRIQLIGTPRHCISYTIMPPQFARLGATDKSMVPTGGLLGQRRTGSVASLKRHRPYYQHRVSESGRNRAYDDTWPVSRESNLT